MSLSIIFVHTYFMAEVNNDPGIKIRHWYIPSGLLHKSVVGIIRYQIHCSRGKGE